jgi:uncharacterized protein (TIGR02001 family)
MLGTRCTAIMAAVLSTMSVGAHAAVTGSVDVVSDYRFRGVSLSGQEPAVQATLHVSEGGFFAEGFFTTLGDSMTDATVETDLTIGGTHKIAKGTATLSATWYLYPGSREHSVMELIGRYDHPVGPATVSLTAGYAPPQHTLDGNDNLYLGLSATVPIGRPELFASIGRERGALAPGGKLDWQLGVQMTVHGFDASLSYVDCDRNVRDDSLHSMSGATAVFQIGHSF